ncbi:MAG: transcription elongation factor GreA [Deltaproteobacteria bacterium]|nr:transcription elongation factor GreA [Deltaproteobacteria bacterium]
MSDRTPMTLKGHEEMKKLLDQLTGIERPKIAKAIGVAREHGDLSENAEYHAAKEAQGILEARIRNIETQLATANVIDPSTIRSDKVLFGATLRVVNLETDKEDSFQIVGELEADLEAGKISVRSPIARGLIGKTKGELVDIEVPGGVRCLEILDVVYK